LPLANVQAVQLGIPSLGQAKPHHCIANPKPMTNLRVAFALLIYFVANAKPLHCQ